MDFNSRTGRRFNNKAYTPEYDSKNLASAFDKMKISRKRKFDEISNNDDGISNNETMVNSDFSLHSESQSFQNKREKLTDNENYNKTIKMPRVNNLRRFQSNNNSHFNEKQKNSVADFSEDSCSIARYDKPMELCENDPPQSYHVQSLNKTMFNSYYDDASSGTTYDSNIEEEFVLNYYSQKNKELMKAIGYLNL